MWLCCQSAAGARSFPPGTSTRRAQRRHCVTFGRGMPFQFIGARTRRCSDGGLSRTRPATSCVTPRSSRRMWMSASLLPVTASRSERGYVVTRVGKRREPDHGAEEEDAPKSEDHGPRTKRLQLRTDTGKEEGGRKE